MSTMVPRFFKKRVRGKRDEEDGTGRERCVAVSARKLSLWLSMKRRVLSATACGPGRDEVDTG